jgi:hypothetical protein
VINVQGFETGHVAAVDGIGRIEKQLLFPFFPFLGVKIGNCVRRMQVWQFAVLAEEYCFIF